ncbi:hypothetical protein ACTWPT_58850 [Nonomuraea sp. 3N208]|uniref:hypothetical protein n=1 Tax=Nonomuraea sp. 3N208 TaxID=3457421 RepID=UPI003FD30EC3
MSGIALVRKPGPRIAEGIVTHIEREPVDYERAAAQHDAYVAALAAGGPRTPSPPTTCPTRRSWRTRCWWLGGWPC